MNPECGSRDLIAPRRQPFVHLIVFQGIDLTGASFSAAIAAARDAAAAPLVTLADAAADVEGLSLSSVDTETVDFGTVNGVYIGPLSVPVSYVQIRIDQATIDALPFAMPRGSGDVQLYWDMHITPSGGDDYRALEGKFTVHAGVKGSS